MKKFTFGQNENFVSYEVPASIAHAMIEHVKSGNIYQASNFSALYDDNYFSLFNNGSLVAMGNVSHETLSVVMVEMSIAECNKMAGKEGSYPSLITYGIVGNDDVLLRFRDRFAIVSRKTLSDNTAEYNGFTCYACGFDFPSFNDKLYTLKDYYHITGNVLLENGEYVNSNETSVIYAYDISENGRLYQRFFTDEHAFFISDLSGDRFVNRHKKVLESGEIIANVSSETRYIVRCSRCGKTTLSFRDSGLCHECYNLVQHHTCPICRRDTTEESGYHRDCIVSIGGYHDSHSYERTFYIDGETGVTFGVENELKFPSRDARNEYLTGMRLEFGEMFHFERDGSLSGTACETISEPMNLDYFLHNKIWQRVGKHLSNSHARKDGETGCHIHVGRDSFTDDDAIFRYLTMINSEKLYNVLTVGSGRNRYNTSYHARYRGNVADYDLDEFTSHSYAFTVNDDTVECRCFEAFTSAIQFKRFVLVIVGLVNIANSITMEDAENMTVSEIGRLLSVWRADAGRAWATLAERAGEWV